MLPMGRLKNVMAYRPAQGGKPRSQSTAQIHSIPLVCSYLNRCLLLAVAVLTLLLGACGSRQLVSPPVEPKSAPQVQAPAEVALTKDPQAAQRENEMVSNARQASRQGDSETAERFYTQYLQFFPEGVYAAESLTQLGLLAVRAEAHEAARQYLEQVVKGYPQSPWYATAAMQLVVLNQISGQSDAVIEDATRLLGQPILTQTQRIYLQLWLAQAYFDAGDSLKGLKTAMEAYALGTPFQQAAMAEKMAVLIRQADVVTHRGLVDSLEPGAPRNLLQYQLGLRYLKVGEDALALEAFSALIDGAPDSPEAEAVRAQMAQLEGRAAAREVSLGCLLPLSGPYQAFGQQALAGIEYALLALERSQLGRWLDIKLVVQDTAGDSAHTVAAVQALVHAGVVAAVGAMVTAEEASREMQAAQIPVIALTQQEGIPQVGDYIFRNFIIPHHQIDALVEYTMTGLGLTRFAILYPEEAYGDLYAELFWEAVKQRGGAVVGAVGYATGTTDFRAAITRLVGDEHIRRAISRQPKEETEEALTVDFEALFIPEAAETAALILPQLAYYDVKDLYTLGTHLWHSPKLIEMAGRYGRNSLFPSAFFSGSSSPMVQAFISGFEREFGRTPGLMEAIAYDSAQMIIRAISGLPEVTAERVRDSLQWQGEFEGTTGLTWFDDQGEVSKRLSLLTIEYGGFVELSVN